MIQCKKLHPNAKLPTQQKPGDAGYDLSAVNIHGIAPGERQLIDTGVAVAVPHGYVGLLRERSGCAVKQGLQVMAGVIDSNYRGPVKALVLNNSDRTQWVNEGDRIAQMVVVPCLHIPMGWVDELPETERGEQGFGSSGQ